MRILVPGYHSRVQALSDLMRAAGHEIVMAAEEAEAVLCCQADIDDGLVLRDHLLALVSVLGPQLRAPCLICLVSVEPNAVWPVDFCHTASTTLRFSGATQMFPVTRAHLQSLTPLNPTELILGAPTNDQETLRAIWQPVFATQELSPILTVIGAETDAEYRPQIAPQA